MYGCSGHILIVHYSFLCRFCKRVMSSYCKPIRHCLRHRGHGSAWKRWTGRDCWWPTIYMTNNISKAHQDALRLVTAGKSLTWMCSCRIFLNLFVFLPLFTFSDTSRLILQKILCLSAQNKSRNWHFFFTLLQLPSPVTWVTVLVFSPNSWLATQQPHKSWLMRRLKIVILSLSPLKTFCLG